MGRLPLVLLAYLSVEARPFSRDHLGALLWPKSDRSHQLQNLRQAVLRLRKGAGADILEGNGTLSVLPGTVIPDHAEFLSSIERGDTSSAVEVWKGTFLDGVRRPESWELEDWIDQQRSRLESTLGAAVVSSARSHLEGGDPQAALEMLERPRTLLPYHDEIGALLVVALAGTGRVAEAEGVKGTVDLDVSDDLASEMADALSQTFGAGQMDQVEPLAEEAPKEQSPVSGHRGRKGLRIGHLSLAVLMVAALLITVSAMKGFSAASSKVAGALDGFAILTCTTWATGGSEVQPFRMGFDGSDKHRLLEEPLCRGVWVAEAGALFGTLPDSAGTPRLVRASPQPGNPIAEWVVSPVVSAAHLVAPLLARGNPSVGPGGVLYFSAEGENGNHDIYALETVSEGLRRLTTSDADDRMPSVDRAGGPVVFLSNRTGGGDLYRIEADGSRLERLTGHPLQDSRPWVRGDSVLFVRGRGEGDEDGNMELFLLDLETGTETRLTENTWNDYDPRWSPVGTHICWQSEKEGHYESEIEVMNLDSRETVNITNAEGRDGDCFWTPDGQGVVHLGWRNGMESDLFLASRLGGEPVNLTRYPGEESMIGWFELPKGLRAP